MSEANKIYEVSSAATTADPGPLGLACFALTTFCLSLINAGIVDKSHEGIVIIMALVYGGTIQLLAGMWEFKKNNTFGAVAFSSYGGFWLIFAFYLLGAKWGWITADGPSTAMFLISFTIFTVYMWIGSFALNKALATTFTLLIIAFVLLDLGALGNHSAHTMGGYVGILTAFAAWYTSAAAVLNGVYKKVVLPVGPFNR